MSHDSRPSPGADADEGLERLLASVRPEVPPDAAERVLAGLDPTRVAAALWWGEVERAARGALWLSALGALLGLVVLAAALLHGSGAHLHPNRDPQAEPHPLGSGQPPLLLAESSAAVREARRLADPFSREERR